MVLKRTQIMDSLCLMGTVFICIYNIHVMVLAQGSFNKTVQIFQPSCDLTQPCPHVSSQHSVEWQNRQHSCCSWRRGLLFHCQYQKDSQHLVVACLPNNTCSAGTYPRIFREESKKVTLAWVECLPCDSTHYEEQEKPTYMQRYDSCSREKHTCRKSSGKALCSEGGSQADDKSRCMHEDNYAPFPDSESCLCFDMTAVCECYQKRCSHDEVLNEDYACVRSSSVAVNLTTSGSLGVMNKIKTKIVEHYESPQLRKELTWQGADQSTPIWFGTIVVVIGLICFGFTIFLRVIIQAKKCNVISKQWRSRGQSPVKSILPGN